MRFALLQESWQLRGWTDLPRAVTNWKTGELIELGQDGFYVAQSCDGKTDFDSLAFLPGHRALLDRFIANGIARECTAGERLAAAQGYRKSASPFIRGVHWAITGRCNMNCGHCFMQAPSGRYPHPDGHSVRRLLDQFSDANVLEVSLTGGEPLMRDDLADIIGELTARRMRLTEIVTNGVLINSELLDALRRYGQAPIFKISFDGAGIHDEIRGMAGAEERVAEAIRQVLAAGFTAAVSSTISRNNVGVLAATYAWVRELGIPVWLVGRPQTTGDWHGGAADLSTAEMAEACLGLLGRWLEDGRPFHICLENFFSGGPATAPRRFREDPFDGDSYECGATRERPYLLPDGKLLPCAGYTGTTVHAMMPNILDSDLSTGWKASTLRSFIDKKKQEVLEQNPECAGCRQFTVCGAGCRAYALTEAGALTASDPIACAVWKGGHRRRFLAAESDCPQRRSQSPP